MKKIIALLFLATALVPKSNVAQDEMVRFTSPLLDFVDRAGIINVPKIFFFAKNVLSILNGTDIERIKMLEKKFSLNIDFALLEGCLKNNGKSMDSKNIGLIPFHGEYKTVSEMIEYEKNHESDHENNYELEHALKRTCELFDLISRSYNGSIKRTKHHMVNLVVEWSKLRDRRNSPLLFWMELDINNRDELKEKINSFSDVGILFSDLLQFLKDLIQNCPITHQKYRETLAG